MSVSTKQRCMDRCATRASTGRREAVRKAAIDIFARRGFHATSTAEVARLAGVSEGTVFYYFGNKESVLLALLDEVNQQYHQGVERLLAEAADGTAAMLACVQFHFQQARQNSRLLTLLVRDLPASFGRGDSKCRRVVRKHTVLMLEAMSQGLRRGQVDGSVAAELPVAETALLIRSLLIGSTRMLLLKLAIEVDYADQAVEFCRRALAPSR